MRNDRFAKAPLLYIQQANTEKIQANMQHQYMSKKGIKQADIHDNRAEQTIERKQKKYRPESFYEAKNSLIEEEREEGVSNENKEEGTQGTRVQKKREEKSFKDMTLDEKLVYLTEKPLYAPRLTCEIKIEKRTYRGIVLQYENEVAKIRSGKRTIEIPLASIKHIRILGL